MPKYKFPDFKTWLTRNLQEQIGENYKSHPVWIINWNIFLKIWENDDNWQNFLISVSSYRRGEISEQEAGIKISFYEKVKAWMEELENQERINQLDLVKKKLSKWTEIIKQSLKN